MLPELANQMTKDLPLVSVILPTYNRAELLPRAINSVLTQTYPFWELIIWDDGSIDNTRDIVGSYKDRRIRYYADHNQGVAQARNRAIEVSTGTYLAFLDSDDEWVESKLDDQVQAMLTYPKIDVLFSDFLNINVATREKSRVFEQYSSVIRMLGIEQMRGSLFLVKFGLPETLAYENFIGTDTVIIRRDLLQNIGCFSQELRNSEDFELWWRMGMTGVCFAYLNKIQLIRYKLSENLSGSSILTYKNVLHSLDVCRQESMAHGRTDLIPYLNSYYRNVWQNLIDLYSRSGAPFDAIKAFIQSLKYGFRLASVRLLLEAILR